MGACLHAPKLLYGKRCGSWGNKALCYVCDFGRMELEVIDLLVEKAAAIFIIDCLPNL